MTTWKCRVEHRMTVLLGVLAVVLASDRSHAENWPGWRGAARNGISHETGLPLSWSEKQGVLWKVALPGSGISNPIVWGDRVFLTSSDGRDQDELHLICLSRDDGGERWHLRLWGSATTRVSPTNTPSPTRSCSRKVSTSS